MLFNLLKVLKLKYKDTTKGVWLNCYPIVILIVKCSVVHEAWVESVNTGISTNIGSMSAYWV